MQDRSLVTESLQHTGLAPELAASARERIVRLEVDNARLKHENRVLQERLVTLRLQEGHRAAGSTRSSVIGDSRA